ncbi:hypothetical protein HRG_003870 [Hirsutella rhossiliensis]|uniref:Folliculin-interacting protein N-terminal domain-containing protein n=1 Tax=Hirsutella rhossiliensis TaxID=111463 RepID=A0A9P8SL32_9HYPO|nr:uncharacterized protein HRG_03870 [Hirsutella rhossiliensis]KAH0965854.1 hypothetical protein HRG_03870 [Hirsutella rhossiliensis]
MLGRLLHLGSGGSATPQAQAGSSGASRPILSLESVQEDIHTRNLLFPDAHALHLHRNDQVFPLSTAPATPSASAANAFDYSEDIELDVRDVRVIVLQDALGPANASLLFDSHPFPEASAERSPARKDARKPPMSPRGDMASQSHASRPFASHRSQSYAETDAQRAAREYREELATFSSCIFGNSELMAYKGTSTKVHVVPSDSRPADHSSSVFGDGRSSIGRSSGRSSKLSQSLSSQAVSPIIGPPVPPTGTAARQMDKKKVLITRLFPVNLPVDDADNNVLPQSRFSDDNGAFPFPGPGEEPSPKKKSQPKQRRTPMYAVVLVVQLPRSSSRMSSAAPLKSIFRECGSYNDQDLFSSSYNSTKAGWSMGSGICGDATDSSYSIDMEDRIDSLTQHWDIIMRTLTHLQSMVATTLHTMLKQADLASPGPYRRGHDMSRAKPSKGTTKLVSLLPNCLVDDINIASEVGLARSRVVMGLSAARVITGQGRWGIWRDEAIWMSRWALTMDHGQFFYNLLTGFLAIHTDWLQALCGPTYRKRAATVRQGRNEEDLSLPARTIIVSDDKMAARRLIFLLSGFLPANQQVATARTHRPSTSTSVGGYSHSPPTFVVPILREESLRRKINRRSGLRRASHSRTASQSARGSTVPSQLAQLSLERNQHQRRASDAASVRTTNLPMPGQDILVRKSSAATTTTVMAETTTPHFSSAQQQRDGHRRRRPGSSGSVAADDLKRSLKRGESSGGPAAATSTRPPSQGLRWGNLVSGLWSPRRRDSLDDDTASPGTEYRSPVKSSFGRSDKLFEMAQEVALVEETDASMPSRKGPGSGARNFGVPQDDATPSQASFAQADRTPDPSGAFESPVKTSINAEDGVIDVDVPFPDYIASFESAISSPSSSGYLSTPGFPGGLEFFEQSARFSIDGDLPLNAAGWLNRFHPDFALQALPPQDNLLENIKASLRAEPTPIHDCASGNETCERWVDVSSVIIADTTSNSITRHVYRRLVKPKIPAERPGQSNANGLIPLTPFILTYECHFEEDWIEEDISTSDTALREAIERVIHFTPDTSKGSSTNSSQTPSDSRRSTDSGRTMPDAVSETTQMADTPLDIPRVQCKTVILSTLEDMVRDAVDNRDLNGEGRGGSYKHLRPSQNILREAVRQWATNLEAVE